MVVAPRAFAFEPEAHARGVAVERLGVLGQRNMHEDQGPDLRAAAPFELLAPAFVPGDLPGIHTGVGAVVGVVVVRIHDVEHGGAAAVVRVDRHRERALWLPGRVEPRIDAAGQRTHRGVHLVAREVLFRVVVAERHGIRHALARQQCSDAAEQRSGRPVVDEVARQHDQIGPLAVDQVGHHRQHVARAACGSGVVEVGELEDAEPSVGTEAQRGAFAAVVRRVGALCRGLRAAGCGGFRPCLRGARGFGLRPRLRRARFFGHCPHFRDAGGFGRCPQLDRARAFGHRPRLRPQRLRPVRFAACGAECRRRLPVRRCTERAQRKQKRRQESERAVHPRGVRAIRTTFSPPPSRGP